MHKEKQTPAIKCEKKYVCGCLEVEREIYVYFVKDEDYLKDVENLENKSKIKASEFKD